jgi:putative phosphonate metabolism protein
MTAAGNGNEASAGSRYAVYFVPAPSSELYRFGAAALRYDCYTGVDVAPLFDAAVSPADWTELTREPRTYGFHATLKAPFRLRPEYHESDLLDSFRTFVSVTHHLPTIMPSIDVLESFIAIVPVEANPELDALAAACVQAFDPFRAPMTDEERVRRVGPGLTPRQTQNIDRWGYPYVFEDFRFHMTLTGRIQPDRRAAILSLLQEQFSKCHGEHPIAVNGIALLRQDHPDARFRVIDHSFATIS